MINSLSNNGRHAYLIIAHDRFDQLRILLSALDDPRNDLFLHIDIKADYSRQLCDFLREDIKYSRLYFCSRVRITWAGFSMVKAELNLLRLASEGHYDYYHLLSCLDFPLQTQDELHAFFSKNKGYEFVHFCDEVFQNRFKERLQYYWLFQESIGQNKTIKAKILNRIRCRLLSLQKWIGINRLTSGSFQEARAGSQWFSVTDDFVHYLLSREKDIYRTFRRTMCPDEELIQTVIWNSEFRRKLYPNSQAHPGNLRKTDWNRGTPYVWKNQDYDELMQSGCIFARKIIMSQEPELFGRLLENISSRGENFDRVLPKSNPQK